MRAFTILMLWVLCIASACQHPNQQHAAAKAVPSAKPHRDTLRQNFWESRQITVIYPAVLDETVRKLADALGSFEVRFLQATDAKPEDTKGSLFLIGTPTDNPWLRKVQPQPALSVQKDQIRLNGEEIPAETVAFLSFYPNPQSLRYPIFIATAYDSAYLQQVLQQRLEQGFSAFGWGGWQYEAYQGQYRVKCGKYHPKTWAPTAEQQPIHSPLSLPVRPSPFFECRWHGDAPDTVYYPRVVSACNQQAEAVLSFCGAHWEEEPLALHCFPSMEAKGLALNNTSPVQVGKNAGRADVIANAIYSNYWLGAQNQLLLRQLLGRPRTALLEAGLALTFNPDWQKKGFRHWASQLDGTGLLPSLPGLEKYWADEHHSPLIRQIAAAAFCDFLIQFWGKTAFLERYAEWQPSQPELLAMEGHWQAYLKKGNAAPPPQSAPLPYLKGFNFAHEGYSVYNGYGSRLAAEMLEEQAKLGANAVAIVPYSYLRYPESPTPLPLMGRAGTENDESVIRDLLYAHQLGLQTVLKPQIWLGGGHWPGDVQMQSEADWAAFFEYYTQWIAHYALLAEIYGADLFCVGVEFAKATLERPEDWRKVIETVRSIYRGPITYAANWGTEFEKLEFWADLDFIGLNCYYPLSEAKNPPKADLARQFSQVLRKAKAVSTTHKRPLLLTEIGFTSTTMPWLQPHQDGDGKAYSGTAQLKCYQMATQALAGETDWCKGVLWWKYPSYPSLGGDGHTGFTPNNKPTEQQLPKLFGQLPD